MVSRIAGDPVRLDVAVERLLIEPVDRVTRSDLRGLQAHIRKGGRTGQEGLDPPSLADVVLDAVMPRLSHPDVLRLDRRQKALERLEARAAADDNNDPALMGGLVMLRHELQNLSLLRRHRDRLIEG